MTEKSTFQTFAGMVSPLLAIATFWWGIYTYREASAAQLKKDEADAIRTAETRRIEATKPFLDKQLAAYTKATTLAARTASNASNLELFQRLKKEFRELYWGEMGLVEHGEVERAMARFNEMLDLEAGEEGLGFFALQLAHACRKELAASWGTDAWLRHKSPESDPAKITTTAPLSPNP